MTTPATVQAGQQFTVTWHFNNAKTGFLAMLPGGTGQFYNSAAKDAWAAYMTAQGMIAKVDFSGATDITGTFTAPAQAGAYEIQGIVPDDGGTVGVDTFTVTGTAAAAPPSTAGPQVPAGSQPHGSFNLTTWLSGSTAGIPNMLLAGVPVVLLLMRR